MNKRIGSLEAMPVWDHSALLGMQERIERLEAAVDAKIKDLRLGQQQLRMLLTQVQAQPPVNEPAARRPGAWRAIWNFLWGQ